MSLADGVALRPLDSASPSSDWRPDSVKCVLQASLEAGIVPSARFGARADEGALLVLDGLLDEGLREGLLRHLVGPDWQHGQPLPADRWDRSTCDADFLSAAPQQRTYGPRGELLEALETGGVGPSLELQRRVCAILPEFSCFFMPSDAMVEREGSPWGTEEEDGRGDPGREAGAGPGTSEGQGSPREKDRPGGTSGNGPSSSQPRGSFRCTPVLANAAVRGDVYNYHQDVDPTTLPDSEYTDAYGRYFNREPGRPYLVSLLVYLNHEWRAEWGGETLFLDSTTGTGCYVVPRPGRALLMDQDLLHKLAPPTGPVEPRFSLVFKLLLVRKDEADPSNCSLLSARWGPRTHFGSSAVLQVAKRKSLADARARQGQERAMGAEGET